MTKSLFVRFCSTLQAVTPRGACTGRSCMAAHAPPCQPHKAGTPTHVDQLTAAMRAALAAHRLHRSAASTATGIVLLVGAQLASAGSSAACMQLAHARLRSTPPPCPRASAMPTIAGANGQTPHCHPANRALTLNPACVCARPGSYPPDPAVPLCNVPASSTPSDCCRGRLCVPATRHP